MLKKYKIFVSGVQKDLKTERRAIKDFVLADPLVSEYFDVFLFEDAPAKSKPAEKAYLERARKSDVYLGLLGAQYGVSRKGNPSPTEAEFREAKSHHKHILIYIKGENGANDRKREAGVQKLIKEIRDSKRGFSYKRFHDTGELTRLVHASLIDFLKEEGIVGRGAFDERICADAAFKDIDDEKVRWFLKAARAARIIQQAGSSRFHRPFEIPEFSIQEAITNAVAHRNYNVTSGVQVMVFADRVEVWNSGSLPEGLTVEDLRKPHTSFPANPLLANALYLADYAQRAGSGTLEMIEQSQAQGAPEPEFVLIRNLEFRSILPRDYLTPDVLNRIGLNERQIKAIKFVKEHGGISRRTYVDLSSVSPRQALLDLTSLVKKKLLAPLGKGRAARYSLRR